MASSKVTRVKLQFHHEPVDHDGTRQIIEIFQHVNFGQNFASFERSCDEIGLKRTYFSEESVTYRHPQELIWLNARFHEDYFQKEYSTLIVSSQLASIVSFTWEHPFFEHKINWSARKLFLSYKRSCTMYLGNPWLDILRPFRGNLHWRFFNLGYFCLWKTGNSFIALGIEQDGEPQFDITLIKVKVDSIHRFDLGELRIAQMKKMVLDLPEERIYGHKDEDAPDTYE